MTLLRRYCDKGAFGRNTDDRVAVWALCAGVDDARSLKFKNRLCNMVTNIFRSQGAYLLRRKAEELLNNAAVKQLSIGPRSEVPGHR